MKKPRAAAKPARRASRRSAAREGAAPAGLPSAYANVVSALEGQPGVSYGGKGFGGTALKFKGKIFAMASSKGEFVVKLPATRVDELVGAGKGHCFDPGHGRLMKEWLVVTAPSARWLEFADEARDHAQASDRSR